MTPLSTETVRPSASQTAHLKKWLLGLCFAIAFFACFLRLGSPAFWDDEAHVGLFARQILATGSNIGWDGRNLIPDRNAEYYLADLKYTLPQFDNYLVAASFKVFGESTWAGRFPFALCGFLSFVIFWQLLKLEFPGQATLRLYIFAASLSVGLFLYVRTCRYYGFSLLMTISIFYAYRRFLKHHDWCSMVVLGVCGGLLSLSSVLNTACVLGALGVRHLIFHLHETTSIKNWLKIGTACSIFGAITLPYVEKFILLNMELTHQRWQAEHITPPPTLISAVVRLWWNIQGLNMVNALPWAVAILFLAFLYYVYCSDTKSTRELRPTTNVFLEYFVTLCGFLILLAFISPQWIDYTTIADVRYFMPCLLFIAILVGGTFWYIHRWSKIVALVFLLAYLTTNIFALIPGSVDFATPLFDFCYELSTPYPTAAEAVSNFLNKYAHQDETVWIEPNQMGKSILFYSGKKIKLRGCFNRQLMLEAPRKAIEQLDQQLFSDSVYPDWLVSFGVQTTLDPLLTSLSRNHIENGKIISYQYQLVQVLNVYFAETQRPDLPWHHFGPVEKFPLNSSAVYIFKRSLKDPPVSEPVHP